MDDKTKKRPFERQIPPPESDLQVNFTTWPAGQCIYRIHAKCYMAGQFNPGMQGSARFSPLRNSQNQLVPTIYGGESSGVAVMETIFHDLPPRTDGQAFDKGNLLGLVYSVIAPKTDLKLVDLNPKTLKKMGITRAQLLDSAAEQYVYTQEYAAAIHMTQPMAHGLMWSSKQHGDSTLMLFGDRVNEQQLDIIIESEVIVNSVTVMDVIEDEADQLGIVFTEMGGGKEPDIAGP